MSFSKNQPINGAVINELNGRFANVIDKEIIQSVASEFSYDMERSSNVLLEMTSQIQNTNKPKRTPNRTKKHEAPRFQPNVVKSKKSQDLDRVVQSIRRGYKVLVILRGLPGSGKSSLASTIVEMSLNRGIHSSHILSTDDYFKQRGFYVYDSNRIGEAHDWNQWRAFQAMSNGLSPVVIDNTNTKMWEMKPYAVMAIDFGYIIEILEPDTWWVFNDRELAKRNCHNVPRGKIQEMLERYQKNVTPMQLMCAYNLQYQLQKPPQFRQNPPIDNNVGRSQSLGDLQTHSNINLMEFSEIGSHDNGDSCNANNLNPIDDILMCNEENTSDVLQPDQVGTTNCQTKNFPDLETAWGIDEKAIQSWEITAPITCDGTETSEVTYNDIEKKTEMKDSSTNFDSGDFCSGNIVPFGFKILQGRNRDININSPVRTVLPPPKKIMIDQSSTTDDLDTEDRLKDLMDLFPRISKNILQEFYNKCQKNFHWTIDLILEEENLETIELQEEIIEETPPIEIENIPKEPPKEKQFKQKIISNDSLELKKCFEEKFDINPEHYSDKLYKIKSMKFGRANEPQPSTSQEPNISSSEEEDEDDPKNMMEINLGETFVQQLDTLFGARDVFPQGYQPVVQMPLNLVRQIYSFYIDSMCQQMDAQNHILEQLQKEDEEFARKLQQQEEEQPRSLNFAEIMDEQLAMNLHNNAIDSWKNMTSAETLAAKLTKQKLFATFPKVDKNDLLEVWHAYNCNYNKTVEVLMASIGHEEIVGPLETVSQPPVTENVLEEMKDAELACVPIDEMEEQQPATFYREQANEHLQRRQELYSKANCYYQRGMTEVATFYSELAQKQTKFYDRANHYAATAFIDEHSQRLQKFDTLDLHFLYVKEAIQTLDLFIDRNIHLLKGGTKRRQDLFVITGRGKNSEGGRSKIKPAVITRLKKRNISYVQLNPGLLKIRVSRDSIITSDI